MLSARVKTKDRMRVYVSEEVKRSRSWGDRMRRTGVVKWIVEGEGGGGRGFVAGTGSGLDVRLGRWRGVSRGSLAERSGGLVEGEVFEVLGAGSSVLDGILVERLEAEGY